MQSAGVIMKLQRAVAARVARLENTAGRWTWDKVTSSITSSYMAEEVSNVDCHFESSVRKQ